MPDLKIIKNTGELVSFDPEKLKQSLLRSGASLLNAEYVTDKINKSIVNGMSSHKIYRQAYELLRKQSGRVASRYKLKKAIFEMGPTGYPFERLISELLKQNGYETDSGIIMNGNCIQHEVDVYARKNNKIIFAECKFHNDAKKKSDVKVSLYVKSRFEDLKAKKEKETGDNHIFEGWIVTNTRFTSDATNYGICSGLKLISWDYPKNGNLRQLIDSAGLHPITTMRSITKKEKPILLENDIVLCRQIIQHVDYLKKMEIGNKRIDRIIKEANQIIAAESNI